MLIERVGERVSIEDRRLIDEQCSFIKPTYTSNIDYDALDSSYWITWKLQSEPVVLIQLPVTCAIYLVSDDNVMYKTSGFIFTETQRLIVLAGELVLNQETNRVVLLVSECLGNGDCQTRMAQARVLTDFVEMAPINHSNAGNIIESVEYKMHMVSRHARAVAHSHPFEFNRFIIDGMEMRCSSSTAVSKIYSLERNDERALNCVTAVSTSATSRVGQHHSVQ